MAAPTIPEFLARPYEPTMRNQCAAGCGHVHSGADPHPPVMVPDVGLVCADCISDRTSEAVDQLPSVL